MLKHVSSFVCSWFIFPHFKNTLSHTHPDLVFSFFRCSILGFFFVLFPVGRMRFLLFFGFFFFCRFLALTLHCTRTEGTFTLCCEVLLVVRVLVCVCVYIYIFSLGKRTIFSLTELFFLLQTVAGDKIATRALWEFLHLYLLTHESARGWIGLMGP
jgi:hypothetical protein